MTSSLQQFHKPFLGYPFPISNTNLTYPYMNAMNFYNPSMMTNQIEDNNILGLESFQNFIASMAGDISAKQGKVSNEGGYFGSNIIKTPGNNLPNLNNFHLSLQYIL